MRARIACPFLVSIPDGLTGAASGRTVELLDIYPTLAELCGLRAPANLQGKSLVPSLQGPDAAWDKPAYTQVRRGDFFGRSIRTERWRYSAWDEGRAGKELYDHANDPEEFTNLAQNPAYQQQVDSLSQKLRQGYN